jgi:DNA-directed RNA polymerase subunit omega
VEDRNVIDSKFRLVILAAKRAKQLLKGSKKRVDLNMENPLSIALEEIRQGKIDFEILLQDDIPVPENGTPETAGGNALSDDIFSEVESEPDSEIENDSDEQEGEPAEPEDEEEG